MLCDANPQIYNGKLILRQPSHVVAVVLGKTGIGKSTLINGIFGFNQNEGALEGVGKPITQKFEEFVSDKRKGLRLIDSKGIEMGEYNINSVIILLINLSQNMILDLVNKSQFNYLKIFILNDSHYSKFKILHLHK